MAKKKIEYKCEKCNALYETETALRNHKCEPPLPKPVAPKHRMMQFTTGQYFQG